MLRGFVPVSFRRYSDPFQSPRSLIVSPVSTASIPLHPPHIASSRRQIKPSVVCRSAVQNSIVHPAVTQSAIFAFSAEKLKNSAQVRPFSSIRPFGLLRRGARRLASLDPRELPSSPRQVRSKGLDADRRPMACSTCLGRWRLAHTRWLGASRRRPPEA